MKTLAHGDIERPVTAHWRSSPCAKRWPIRAGCTCSRRVPSPSSSIFLPPAASGVLRDRRGREFFPLSRRAAGFEPEKGA